MKRAFIGLGAAALAGAVMAACALPSRDEFTSGNAVDPTEGGVITSDGGPAADTGPDGTVVVPPSTGCATACDQLCENGACQTVTTTQRAEVPCTSTATLCTTGPAATVDATAGGIAAHDYLVTFRVRGVVEEKGYPGGTTIAPHVQRGGTPNSDGRNIAQLEVSVPQATFYLNAASSPAGSSAMVDSTFDVKVASGAKLTLTLDPLDGKQLHNAGMSGSPIVIPDIPPAPSSFDGQFLQLDVVKVVAD